MIKPVPKSTGVKNRTDKPNRQPTTRSPRKTKAKVSAIDKRQTLILLAFEVLGLGVVTVTAIIFILGYSANLLSGTNLFVNLLPFAFSLLVFMLIVGMGLFGWLKIRSFFNHTIPWLIPALAIGLALLAGWYTFQDPFAQVFGHFRTLVGGKQEAGRVTLTHQVYAAYRRYDPKQLQTLVDRAQPYQAVIIEAADRFDIDVNLLLGIAATESSFLPRDSLDGGHGLFQITRVPNTIIATTAKQFEIENLSLNNPRHNAYLAAATFDYYLEEMHGDLFLGLLAYNIGPKNGGLRFIMDKYGVTDFITIQPYLQQLPRDYPIRVLAYSLAFRLKQRLGKILAYEQGKNARLIQRIGIPGLPK